MSDLLDKIYTTRDQFIQVLGKRPTVIAANLKTLRELSWEIDPYVKGNMGGRGVLSLSEILGMKILSRDDIPDGRFFFSDDETQFPELIKNG